MTNKDNITLREFMELYDKNLKSFAKDTEKYVEEKKRDAEYYQGKVDAINNCIEMIDETIEEIMKPEK